MYGTCESCARLGDPRGMNKQEELLVPYGELRRGWLAGKSRLILNQGPAVKRGPEMPHVTSLINATSTASQA